MIKKHFFREKIAFKALNQLKKSMDLYPAVKGVGLGKDEKNKFVIRVYVSSQYFKNTQKIPQLVCVEDDVKKGRFFKVPTKIEEICGVQLLTL